MCVIAIKPIESKLTRKEIYNCWSNNLDGAGFMYTDPGTGKIHIHKELYSFARFYRKYRKAELKHGAETPFVLHFRRKTIGDVNIGNTHPFRISAKVAFCHNGSINFPMSDKVPKNEDISDTRWFCRLILMGLSPEFYRNRSTMILLQDFSPKSKMVFLDHKGRVTISNEEAGIWDDHRWFSNNSFQLSKAEVDEALAKQVVEDAAAKVKAPVYQQYKRKSKVYKGHRYQGSQSKGSKFEKCNKCGIWTVLINNLCAWCNSKDHCKTCNEPLVGQREIAAGLCLKCMKDEAMQDTQPKWMPPIGLPVGERVGS